MKRARKKSRARRLITLALLLFAASFAVATLVVVNTQLQRYAGYRQTLDGLQNEILAEEQFSLDLILREAFYASDAYIEQLVRERLGYVRSDEVILVNIGQ